jgi:hypothetical protein
MSDISEFCRIVRQRSVENSNASLLLFRSGLKGHVIGVLRQELDSMVRVIYLLNQSEVDRSKLISQTLTGVKWRLTSGRQVTDRDMVDIADRLNGWTLSVYKFGCAFIHLSFYHDYQLCDPFKSISINDKIDIVKHLNGYHGYPLDRDLSLDSISMYMPMIQEKISSHLECYLKDLEKLDV